MWIWGNKESFLKTLTAIKILILYEKEYGSYENNYRNHSQQLLHKLYGYMKDRPDPKIVIYGNYSKKVIMDSHSNQLLNKTVKDMKRKKCVR